MDRLPEHEPRLSTVEREILGLLHPIEWCTAGVIADRDEAQRKADPNQRLAWRLFGYSRRGKIYVKLDTLHRLGFAERRPIVTPLGGNSREYRLSSSGLTVRTSNPSPDDRSSEPDGELAR